MKVKKVALISPRGNIFGKSEKIKSFIERSDVMESFKFLWSGPNLGLLTIAAFLPEDWEAEYIDENYISINYEKNYDLVFIGCMTQQAVNAYSIAAKYRDKGCLTVLGGIHPTLMPEEALNYSDVVIVGEGEDIMQEFLADYESNKLKRKYTAEKPGEYSLTNSPIPRYDLLKKYNYPVLTIQTTRGCPHDCSFCAASKVYGKKYRRKNNEHIIKEVKVLINEFPDTLLMFADDNMFVLRKKCKELLNSLIGLNFRWIAQTDISIADDEELLKLMVQAGCQWIVIGFESVSQFSLKDLDKNNWKLKQQLTYKDKIKKIQDFGIGIYGTFIVGLDQDTKQIFEETFQFIRDTNLYGVNITVPTPLPGTLLREQLEKENRILTNDWSYYTFWDINIQPKNFSISELEDGLLYLYNAVNNNESANTRMQHLKKMIKRKREIIN